MNNHLDFDTDFLNNPTSKKVPPANTSGGDNSGKGGGNKLWITVAVIIGIVVVASVWDDSNSSSTYAPTTPAVPTPEATPTTDDHSFEYNGQTFSCSNYHYDQAVAMRPDPTVTAQIKSESSVLDSRISAMDAENARIKNMYVDEYDQHSVDAYNEAVNAYNFKKNRLQNDMNSWNSKNTAFNAKVDAYNSYLDVNCRPQ